MAEAGADSKWRVVLSWILLNSQRRSRSRVFRNKLPKINIFRIQLIKCYNPWPNIQWMNPKGMENQMRVGEERKVNFYRKSPRGIETVHKKNGRMGQIWEQRVNKFIRWGLPICQDRKIYWQKNKCINKWANWTKLLDFWDHKPCVHKLDNMAVLNESCGIVLKCFRDPNFTI